MQSLKAAMQPRTIFLITLLVYFISVVLSDAILFEKGFIKFASNDRRPKKRQRYKNVTHIDNNLISGNHPVIIVKTRSLPVLHSEGVRNLITLQKLVMMNCGIRKIEARAFVNLPNLTTVHLHENELTEIATGIFNGLPITTLALQRNMITKIDSEAFDNMPNLSIIKLNSNKLKVWDADWFKSCPKITELYFRRNKLNLLPPRAFANIKGSHLVDGKLVVDTKIFLSKNKLGVITPESFHNMDKISQLYLDRNGITEIPDEAFRDLEEIDVIYLARNKIHEIKENAFPKVRKIGFLDLSANLLECLPYKLVSVANHTDLEKNYGICQCVIDYEKMLVKENKTSEIFYDSECQNKTANVL